MESLIFLYFTHYSFLAKEDVECCEVFLPSIVGGLLQKFLYLDHLLYSQLTSAPSIFIRESVCLSLSAVVAISLM